MPAWKAPTTEKDLVKIAPLWSRFAPPLYAPRIAMELDDPARFGERRRRAWAGQRE